MERAGEGVGWRREKRRRMYAVVPRGRGASGHVLQNRRHCEFSRTRASEDDHDCRSGGSWVESAICRSNAESARESPAFTFPVGLIALRKGTENAAELPREIYGCVGRAFFCSEEFLPFYNVKMA
jgi:hypothetical protein